MKIITILSIMMCGHPVGLPEDACEVTETYRLEAQSQREADDDWSVCLGWRAARMLNKKPEEEVECDQFSSHLEPASAKRVSF